MRRRVTGWVGEVLVTLGLLLLLFALWQTWWTDVVSTRESAQIVSRLQDRFAVVPGDGSGAAAPATPGAGVATGPVLSDGAFALVAVPRFGADWVRPVLEGTGPEVLARGVGHYPGTAAPGEVGNFAIAGHRTTHGKPFADIDALRPGDRIVVETAAGVYVYAVTGHEIVRPSDVAVIAPVPDEPGVTATARMLTMTSCHPRYSARERYVVHARLVQTLPPDRVGDALAVPAGG